MADIFDKISPDSTAPGFDSSKYNTKLSPQDEIQFQGWKAKYAPNDSGTDYDLRGAYKAGIKPDAQRGHFPDTFKKPNHPTFSTESQYSGKDGFVGGKWGDGDSYTPSATNLQFKQPQELQQYFQQNEPNSKLNLPVQQKQDIFDRISRNYPVRSQLPGGDETNVRTELSNVAKQAPSVLPLVGGAFGGIPGAAAGSFAKQALSPEPSIGGGVADTFLNGVIPAGIEAGFAKGLKGSAAALISKLPQSVIDRIPGVVKSKLTTQLAEQSVPQAASVSAKQSADLVTKYAKPSTGSFDSAGLLDDLAGPNAAKYKMQFGEGGYKTLKNLADSANSAGVGKQADSLLSWKEGRKLAISAGGLHLLGVPPMVTGATTSLILGADAMKRVLGDPKLGALVLQALKTGGKAPESSMLMKSAMLGLRGTTLYLTGPDGQKDEVQVGQDQQGNPQLQTAAPKR